MRRMFAIVCLLCSLSTVAGAQGRGGTWLNGRWEGTGYQIDTGTTWAMNFSARGRRFTIEYPTLKCSGTWRLVSVNSRRAVFRERIKVGLGECVNQGVVTIERLNGRQLAYRFSYAGSSEVTASAILNRKK